LKILLISFASLCFLVIAGLFILAWMSRTGEPNGLLKGQLTPCPDTPNCVCTEFEADADHFVEPLDIPTVDAERILARLKAVIRQMGGRIQAEHADYLAVRFTSSIFGFVDDLEVRVDREQGKVQLRSASRVGRGDGGVNRKRVEIMKTIFLGKTG